MARRGRLTKAKYIAFVWFRFSRMLPDFFRKMSKFVQ